MPLASRLVGCAVVLGVSLSATPADAQLIVDGRDDTRAASTARLSPAPPQGQRRVSALPLRRRNVVEILAIHGGFDDIRTQRSVGTITSRVNGQEVERRSIDASATADDDADVSFEWETIVPRLGLSYDVGRDGTNGGYRGYRLYGYYGKYWPEVTSQPTDRSRPTLTLEGSGTIFGGGVGFDYAVSRPVWIRGDYEISRGSAGLSSDRTSFLPTFELRENTSEINVLNQRLSFGVRRALGSQVAVGAGIAGHWTDIGLEGQFSIVDDDAGAAVGIPNQVVEIFTTFAEDFEANALAAIVDLDVCSPTGRMCARADVSSDFSGFSRYSFGVRLGF